MNDTITCLDTNMDDCDEIENNQYTYVCDECDQHISHQSNLMHVPGRGVTGRFFCSDNRIIDMTFVRKCWSDSIDMGRIYKRNRWVNFCQINIFYCFKLVSGIYMVTRTVLKYSMFGATGLEI